MPLDTLTSINFPIAGVPLTEPAAGVAVGLVSRGNVESKDEFYLGQHAVLTGKSII